MVLIEAMACGTPVLSLARGAVPEVVVDGVTGFVRREAEELVEALDRLGEIDPAACRRTWRRVRARAHGRRATSEVYRDCLATTAG